MANGVTDTINVLGAPLDPQTLGARITQAARLAVMMHLGQSMAGGLTHVNTHASNLRQQVTIGGTDPFAVGLSARRQDPDSLATDGELSPVAGRAE